MQFSIRNIIVCTILFFGFLLPNDIYSQDAKVFVPPSCRQTIYGKVTDTNGEIISAQVQIWYKRLEEIIFCFDPSGCEGRTDNLIEMTFTNDVGYYTIEVPADTLVLLVSKGPEWSIFKKELIIGTNEFDGIEINVELQKLYDLKKLGWYGGDMHSHSIHSDGRQSPTEIAYAMKGVGLSWGMLTDHNSCAGKSEWLANRADDFIPILGNEISTEPSNQSVVNGYGHLNQTFIEKLDGTFPDIKNIWAREVFDDHSDLQSIIDATHNQNGIICINHPFQSWDWVGRFKSWNHVKDFDAIEVWNGEPPHSITVNEWDTLGINITTWAMQSWFEILNAGNMIPGFAGSDCHDIYGSGAYPKGKFNWSSTIGNPRTYAYIEKFDEENIKNSVKSGNLFLTSGFGPILLVKANNKIPGEIVEVTKGDDVTIDVNVLCNYPLAEYDEAIRIIQNGKVVKFLATESELTYKNSIELSVDSDCWIIVEALGQWPMASITNPIYIDVFPYGDWDKKSWNDDESIQQWNEFPNHPEITIPNSKFNFKNSMYLQKSSNK